MSTVALRHRGPDQQGTYHSDRVALGAVRLKIIDLSGGDQPFYSDDRDTVLVFNGEIYNHLEIRAELEDLGHRFSTHCDTEVVLRAFLEWDVDSFPRLRGMFALALWNQSRRRLVLARDRVGIKPLYVFRSQEQLYFASELKSLFVHREIPRELNLQALGYYLALNYVPGPFTLVAGVEKLAPGSWLEWLDGQCRTESFWKPGFEQNPRWTSEAAAEVLDHLMTDSVREHLLSDVPLGLWLSGGVDSSALLHYMRKTTSAPIQTFSISFAGRSFDEGRPAREIARLYGTDHHELDVNPSLDLENAIQEIVRFADEPCADAGAVPVWYLSKLSQRAVTVALSGEGSDELFGGYITYRADRLARTARRIPRLVRRSTLSLLRFWPVSNDKISFEYKLKRFLEGSLLPSDEAHTYWNGSFSHSQQTEMLALGTGTHVHSLFDHSIPCGERSGYLTRYLAFDQRYYLTDNLLQKVDRMSMAHSLEVRPPYLDHRIIEFAASLPDHLKISGRKHKVVLRELMRDKIPASILNRPKTGLDIPTHDWFRGPLRPLLLDVLSSSSVDETGLFRSGSVSALVADHLEKRANLGFHLWALLILMLWMKEWRIGTNSIPDLEEAQVSLASSPV